MKRVSKRTTNHTLYVYPFDLDPTAYTPGLVKKTSNYLWTVRNARASPMFTIHVFYR